MGTTSPAYPTPAVIATQPGRGASPGNVRRHQHGGIRHRHGPELAGEFGIDLTSLAGTGPMGRIIIADVVAAQDRATAEAPPERGALPTPATTDRSAPLRPMSSLWFQSEARARSRRSGCMPLCQTARS